MDFHSQIPGFSVSNRIFPGFGIIFLFFHGENKRSFLCLKNEDSILKGSDYAPGP